MLTENLPDHSATSRCEGSVPVRTLHRWRISTLVALMKVGSRMPSGDISGLHLTVKPGQCNPSPLPFLSLQRLFEAGVADIQPGLSVLDMGTGTGVWGLMAAREGAHVTATDLPTVCLKSVEQNAHDNGLEPPEVLHGDLFEPLQGRTFDRILFNPPFHVGTPDSPEDRAYMGGANGEVVTRFLRDAPEYLADGGAAYIILPRLELRHYAALFSRYDVRICASSWIPLLGRCMCLRLRVL